MLGLEYKDFEETLKNKKTKIQNETKELKPWLDLIFSDPNIKNAWIKKKNEKNFRILKGNKEWIQ